MAKKAWLQGGWKVAGKRYPIQSPSGLRVGMIAIEVQHPNGPWEVIYVNESVPEVARLIVKAVNAYVKPDAMSVVQKEERGG